MPHATFVPFTAQTRMSGVDLTGDGGRRQVRKGAAAAVMKWVRDNGGHPTDEVGAIVDAISGTGGTPLVVAEHVDGQPARALGVIHLKDVVKPGMRERFDEMRRMGIRTVMITGDNPLTAKAIADEAGVDDFLAEATPEDKLALIRKEQEGGRLVAMTGDGTNDAPGAGPGRRRRGDEHRHVGRERGRQHGRPRLRPDQAHRDRGDRQAVADHPGCADHVLDRQRHREVLRDHPGHVRRRSTRAWTRSTSCGCPARQSAILSAVIFNALIIIALIPLALRGVRYRPSSASHAADAATCWIYGLGGIIVPFIGIKIIDLLIQFIPGIS